MGLVFVGVSLLLSYPCKSPGCFFDNMIHIRFSISCPTNWRVTKNMQTYKSANVDFQQHLAIPSFSKARCMGYPGYQRCRTMRIHWKLPSWELTDPPSQRYCWRWFSFYQAGIWDPLPRGYNRTTLVLWVYSLHKIIPSKLPSRNPKVLTILPSWLGKVFDSEIWGLVGDVA